MMAGLMVLGLLSACKKDNNNGNLNLDGISFKATTESHDPNAKTYLDGEDVKWMENDHILVCNRADQQADFKVVDGIETMNGTFYTGATFDQAPDYNAAYPYDKVTLSGTTATFVLPQQQTITRTGTFGNGAMPMVAHSSDETLNFYNVCGGICFPMQGAGIHVSKLVLTSKDASDKLWGTFTVDCTAVPVSGNVTSGPMPTYKTGSEGSNVIELVCNGSEGITLTAEAQDFYIMVPPQTMKSGFTLEIFDGTNRIYNRSIEWDAATHANFITRSVVSKVQTPLTFNDPLTVTTVSPTFISQTQAYGQGTVTGDDNNITERGFCWALASETTTPTIANSYKAEGGTASGSFALMFGDTNPMTKDCVYYVRAYAKNATGEVFYGDPIPFATRKDYTNDYNGRMPYAYSVASNRQVNFSMGNLQYKASTNTWRFAEYQFEYVGGVWYGMELGNVYANGEHPDASQNGTKSDNRNIGASYSGWIDLFGWATSGYHDANDTYNTQYRPYSISDANISSTGMWHGSQYYQTNEYGYGPSMDEFNEKHLVGPYSSYDWGVYNNISNDGSYGVGSWRTMTGGSTSEWYYLMELRTTSTINGTNNARFAIAQINVRNNQLCNGVILFPDTYIWPNEVAYYPSQFNNGTLTDFQNGHQWTEAEWSLLEKNGSVFLPAAGERESPTTLITVPNYAGFYHSSTRALPYWVYGNNAYKLVIGSGQYSFSENVHYQGGSVRLVRNVN